MYITTRTSFLNQHFETTTWGGGKVSNFEPVAWCASRRRHGRTRASREGHHCGAVPRGKLRWCIATAPGPRDNARSSLIISRDGSHGCPRGRVRIPRHPESNRAPSGTVLSAAHVRAVLRCFDAPALFRRRDERGPGRLPSRIQWGPGTERNGIDVMSHPFTSKRSTYAPSSSTQVQVPAAPRSARVSPPALDGL